MRKSRAVFVGGWRKWRKIANRIKDQVDWKCIRCKHSHDPINGYTLTIHHLDMDPSNNKWWNLVPLCQRCHLHIQNKIVMEQYYMFEHSEWFKPYVAGYYAFHKGLPDTKEYVIKNQNEILKDFI